MTPAAPPVQGFVQIPIGLQPHPQLRRRLQQPCQPKRGVRGNATFAEHNFVQSVERVAQPLRRLELTDAKWLQILLQQDLARWNRRPQPVGIPSDSLRRGLRTHVPSPTGTLPGTTRSPECCDVPTDPPLAVQADFPRERRDPRFAPLRRSA